MAKGLAETIVLGRIATLAGEAGWGWVEGLAISGGRILAAGPRREIEELGRSRTRRIVLAPDEVALPGLSDAHLHLGAAALAARRLDLAAATTVDEVAALVAEAHRQRPAGGWIVGEGWVGAGWGGKATAEVLDRAAPGRPVALWSHDHHALWVNSAALAAAGIDETTPDPPGGVIGRSDGRPSGLLHESATALVAARIPPPDESELVDALVAFLRSLVSLGVVAVHDPGDLAPDPDLERLWPLYRRLAEQGRLPVRVHAGFSFPSLETVLAGGWRTGMALVATDGEPERAEAAAADWPLRVGWLKLFADGALGSRTARLSQPLLLGPGEPPPPGGLLGVWVTEPAALAEAAERAARAGVATMIHAIGDAAVSAALDALAPLAGQTVARPRIEHVQLANPAHVRRFGPAGVAASIQPVHLRSDAPLARRDWGWRAEAWGYPWADLASGGALIPLGTDAPVEPADPWPGLAMAVSRRHPSWDDPRPFGPHQALDLARTFRAACLDPALVAGEADRGRLVPGARADLVVVPAAALAEPVEPEGALARCRPRLVLVGGQPAFEG